MKRILSLIFTFAAFALLTVGCDALRSVSNNSVVSQGAPYELIVVSDQPQWEGALGDTLRSVLTAPIPYLSQTEPLFDVLRVTNNGFNNLILKHRNILRTVIDPAVSETKATVSYDPYATPQIMVTVTGDSEEALVEYISEHRVSLVEVLERAERDRAIDYAKKFNVQSLNALIKSKFGFDMNVPQGYVLRNEGEDFVWISYEYPTASQGFIIYSYPAVGGVGALSREMLLDARNRFTAKIPGPSDGSYMTTYEEYPTDYSTFRLDGRFWVEMHGLWDVAGDFMGGPFVSFSTIDEATQQVITIDGYVYSPKLGKRNFIRGVEHLIYNVTFPGKDSE